MAGMTLDSEEDENLVAQVIIKAADVSNAAKPFEIASAWTDRIMQEFYSQGAQEKTLGLPISAVG